MAFAQGSRSGLSYIAESTFGTTPTTPTFVALPFNTHSLNLTKDRVEGNEIRPDRMPRVDRHGNRQAGGDFTCDLRQGDFDPFLESAMFNAWSTNVLKVGTTPKYFSIEDGALDIGEYKLFTGMAVSSAAFSIAPNQMVTTTFSMLGKDMTVASSTAASTLTAASANQPFDSYSGAIAIGNVAASSAIATVTGIDFTIDNSLAPTFVVGSPSTPQLEYGFAKVEGTITAYFEDLSLLNRFINETESELEVSVDDPTGAAPYTFLFPRIKINGADVGVDNPQSRIITMPFVAIYDSTESSNLVITRTP